VVRVLQSESRTAHSHLQQALVGLVRFKIGEIVEELV